MINTKHINVLDNQMAELKILLKEIQIESDEHYKNLNKSIGRVSESDSIKSSLLEIKRELKDNKYEIMNQVRNQKDNKETKVSKLAEDIIDLRDQIDIFISTIDESAIQTVKGLQKELGRILSKSGIVSIEDEGMFNEQYQRIVGIKPTTNKILDNQVAQTIKPGYKIGDEFIRTQEVTLYKCIENE